MKKLTEPALLFDEANGFYGPRLIHLLEEGGWEADYLSAEDLDFLARPHCGEYDDALTDVEVGGLTAPDGVHYAVHIDGGVFLIPPGWEWDDDTHWYKKEA